MANNYSCIVDKLGLYCRKYWILQFLKGSLLLITVLLGLIAAGLGIEYLFYTSVPFKIAFVSSLFFIFGLLAYRYVLTPISYLLKLRKFDRVAQAKLVSEHFPELKDHLINVVELGVLPANNALVESSILQKISELPPFSFRLYFNFRLIANAVIGFIIVMITTLTISITVPGYLLQAGYRLIHFTQEFVKPAPFRFVLNNSNLRVLKGGLLVLSVECVGEDLPSGVYVNIGGQNFVMEQEGNHYTYQLNNLQASFSFFFTDLQYVSDRYAIQVIPNPLILSYMVTVTPPGYTGLPAQRYQAVTNFSAPYGSQLAWEFDCSDVDRLILANGEQRLDSVSSDSGIFQLTSTLTKSGSYRVLLQNAEVKSKQVISFEVELMPDDFPTIDVVQLQDSTNLMRFFFKGAIADDYGFHQLQFNLRNMETDSVFNLSILPNLSQQEFYYAVNFKPLRNLGDHFSYYFTISDNDYFHHFKKATSEVFNFEFPDYQDVYNSSEELFGEVEELAGETQQMVQELKQEMADFQYRSISENLSSWDQQQFVQQISAKREQLQRTINQLINKNNQLNSLNNSYSNQRDELLEKQQQIDDLLKEIMTDELQKLFDEFNKLAQEFDQDRLNQLMKRMEFPVEDFSKQLDRNLELLKRYKIEQSLESIISEIHEVAEDEAQQAIDIDRGDLDGVREQENANRERVRELSDQLDRLRESNEELSKPMNIYPMDNEFEGIDKNYKDIDEHLGGNRRKMAKEEIGRNQQQLMNLAFSLQQMLADSQLTQNGEDIDNLKQILKNLVFLSLQQEEILNLSARLSVGDPSLNEVQNQQEFLVLQTQQVEDSLFALASRTPAVSARVSNELSKIDVSLKNTLSHFKDADFRMVLRDQQNAITAFNELALLLNEALENLEKMMANSMPGDQSCDKPGGGGKAGMGKLKDAQQSLKDQLQKMIDGLKNGEQGQLGEQVGKSLMQQEMLKQMIGEMMMDEGVGSSAKEQLRAIEQLIEQNRLDLLGKKIDDSLIRRQNLILDHLLKAEKAEQERDLDEQRESKTADQIFYSNPDSVFEYKGKENNREEDLRYNTIRMRKFYENKFRNYINQLNP
ncbi:DUF4175 family protein [Mangrovibacterium marinum]|uniref:Uncharacterized protein DUF4175 n=1 Tax=Mangrovibacterium marinum TaxID=1639118 RepID=A0A2T5C2I4_9BACT|nr:DUF4175 family protein [Mangrovibacterium marinum]PTN08921.1 uncharacterized protein DUF4175 [Mangrovibacterium marinum]